MFCSLGRLVAVFRVFHAYCDECNKNKKILSRRIEYLIKVNQCGWIMVGKGNGLEVSMENSLSGHSSLGSTVDCVEFKGVACSVLLSQACIVVTISCSYFHCLCA